MHTLDKFVAELKAYLQDREYDYGALFNKENSGKPKFARHEAGCWGSTQTGEYGATDQVDWDVLNAEIDAFCAEFKAKNGK